MSRLGADPEQMEQLAALFDHGATALRSSVDSISSSVHSIFWKGTDSERFQTSWTQRDKRAVSTAADLLAQAAATIRRESAAQLEASASGGTTQLASGAANARQQAGVPPIQGPGAIAPDAANPIAVNNEPYDGPPVVVDAEPWNGPTYEVSVESHTIETTIDAGIIGSVGNELTSTVEKVRLSDGTYIIRVKSEFAGSVGVEIGTIGIGYGKAEANLAEAGYEARLSNGFAVEIAASDEATADQVYEAMKDRTASITNRFTGGGLDLAEVYGQPVLGQPGVEVLSATTRHLGFHDDASSSAWGHKFRADANRSWNETTVDYESGLKVDRTVVVKDNGSGQTAYIAEIHRDPSTGEALLARYEEIETTSRSLQDTGSQALDFMAGPFYNKEHAEITTVVTTQEFDLTDGGASAASIDAGGRDAVLGLGQQHQPDAAIQITTFKGEKEGSEVNVGVGLEVGVSVGASYSTATSAEGMHIDSIMRREAQGSSFERRDF